MRIMLILLAIASQTQAADKIFLVNGKVTSTYEAFKAAERGIKVQRCSEVKGTLIVEGRTTEKAMKCQEVVLFSNSSGMPTWKAKTTGTPWK